VSASLAWAKGLGWTTLLASRDGFLAVGPGRGDCGCDCERECNALFWRFFFGAVFSVFGFGGATMVQVKPSKSELLATASQMRLRLDTRAEVGVSVSVIAPGRGVFMASVWGVASAPGRGGLAIVELGLEGRAIVVLRWVVCGAAQRGVGWASETRGCRQAARVTRRHAQWSRSRLWSQDAGGFADASN
jgi:hypothetical protein